MPDDSIILRGTCSGDKWMDAALAADWFKGCKKNHGGLMMGFSKKSYLLSVLVGIVLIAIPGIACADDQDLSQVEQGTFTLNGANYTYRKCDYYRYSDKGEYFKYYQDGQYYNYNVNGTYYKYYFNGDYYNYLSNGQYYKYYDNGHYYNYQNNGNYYTYNINGNYFNTCAVVPAHWVRGLWIVDQLVCQ